jgi:thiamine biosynthesis lipoprotein
MHLIHQQFKAMGSPCELKLYAESRSKAEQVAATVIQDVQRLEQRYSRYQPESYLSGINQLAGQGGSIRLDEETASLMDYAEACYQESEGMFDVTSGLLRKVWNFKNLKLPEQSEIDAILDKVGWHRLSWNNPVLDFSIAGMELDFGGTVKEYAVDRAAGLCLEAGIIHGLINLGGDIRIIGPHPDGSPWAVGIQHPERPNELLKTLNLYQGAMASSGDYERCIDINGKRYSHVLNPKTGWPVSYLSAVSVVADFCVVAGSASTIAMLKEANGTTWLENFGLPHGWMDVKGHRGGPLFT